MRTHALILAVAAGTLLLAPTSAQDGGSQPGKQEDRKSADKVKELQQERIGTLKTMAEIETALHKIGKGSPEEVLEARVLVCEAELDAAENESDRIAFLKNLVEVFKDLEATAKARKHSAEGTEAAVVKVKARRLEAEIRLERARTHSQGKAKSVEREQGKVVVTNLQAKDVVLAEQFVCQLHSQRQIDVRSQQSGYLAEVHVKEGQAVKRGEVMFKIAPLLFQARLDVALAEVELAAINLKTAERQFQDKVVSEDEVALSRAKLASVQAKAKLAEAELGLTVLRAPFDGLIDRQQQHEGSLLTGREVLTTLSDNSVMWVYFNVPQARYLQFMSNLAKDQEVEAELLLADGRKFTQSGKIAAIEAQFDEESGNVPFRADFPNPNGLLRHGMTGNVLIHRTLKNAIVIPQRATFESLHKRYVYVVDKADVVHQREIVIQSETADDFVIRMGLDVDDRIVLEGVRQIHEGEKLEYELRRP